MLPGEGPYQQASFFSKFSKNNTFDVELRSQYDANEWAVEKTMMTLGWRQAICSSSTKSNLQLRIFEQKFWFEMCGKKSKLPVFVEWKKTMNRTTEEPHTAQGTTMKKIYERICAGALSPCWLSFVFWAHVPYLESWKILLTRIQLFFDFFGSTVLQRSLQRSQPAKLFKNLTNYRLIAELLCGFSRVYKPYYSKTSMLEI